MNICPFCGMDPYEYVDVGIGGRGVPVAVTCCELGPLLFDWRTSKEHTAIAQSVATEIDAIPHGEQRYDKACELFDKLTTGEK